MRFRKSQIPWNKGKTHLKESKNPNWKGDNVGYTALHDWLRKNYGKASKCEHCKTLNAKRYEWALIKGKKYQRKRENFIELCPKCHAKYDNKVPAGWNKGRKETRLEVLKKQSLSHLGNKHSDETRLKMSLSQQLRRRKESNDKIK